MTTTAASSEPVVFANDGPIATITLNRPAVLNAIDLPMAISLESIAQQVEAMDDVRVLVIRGAGRAFCAGGDLRALTGQGGGIESAVHTLLSHHHAFLATLRRMPKLVVSSVHGSAAGAGMSLAFMADFCIAADDARFTPAYAKLGASPDGGGTVGLVDAAGVRRAMQILLVEEEFSAAQALQWGLATRLAPASQLDEETRRFAEHLSRNSPTAVAATKALLYRQAPPVEARLNAEISALIDCIATGAPEQAVTDFSRSRPTSSR